MSSGVVRRLFVATGLVLLACACEKAPSASSRTVSSQPTGPAGPATLPTATVSGATAVTPSSPTPKPKQAIYLQALGKELPDEDVKFVEQSLNAFYDMDVRRLPRVDLPASAKNSKKTRYRAEKLLDLLETLKPEDGKRILGLTGVDISTTKGKHKDWGILGLATIDGTACIISKFRTKRGTKTALHARIRLGKTAVHEIGHTLSLPHCPNRGCLMEDALGTVFTSDREYDLCSTCRQKLQRRGHDLASSDVPIPWPEPNR